MTAVNDIQAEKPESVEQFIQTTPIGELEKLADLIRMFDSHVQKRLKIQEGTE